MSLDANYILVYDNHNYIGEHPSKKDIKYLKEKYGGTFENFNSCNVYWEKPKYTLSQDEYYNLYADQILERKDCELWEIVK